MSNLKCDNTQQSIASTFKKFCKKSVLLKFHLVTKGFENTSTKSGTRMEFSNLQEIIVLHYVIQV